MPILPVRKMAMLRLLSGSAALRSRTTPYFLSAARGFSDSGSHDDFAPKKKAPKHDLSDPKAVQVMIAEHVAAHPVLLYMKGTPSAPQCGFSQQTIRGEGLAARLECLYTFHTHGGLHGA
jgi:hypothetical protein